MRKTNEETKIESPKFYKCEKISRKLCRVLNDKSWYHYYYVDIALQKKDNGQIVFTACGNYRWWWGQCLDFMNDYLKWDFVWDKVYYLWKNYHLNDCHAGTPRQEEFIEMGIKSWELKSHQYDEVKEFLIKWNMYEDDWYRYGSKWLYRPIPENDLWDIFTLINQK